MIKTALTIVVFIMTLLVGVLLIVLGAFLLKKITIFSRVSLPWRLCMSNFFWIALFIFLACIGLPVSEIPYETVNFCFFFVPGPHIYMLSAGINILFFGLGFDVLLEYYLFFYIIPGIVGVIIGGLQWYLIGTWLEYKIKGARVKLL